MNTDRKEKAMKTTEHPGIAVPPNIADDLTRRDFLIGGAAEISNGPSEPEAPTPLHVFLASPKN